MRRCADCRFFVPAEGLEPELAGNCHRYPPTVTARTTGTGDGYYYNDWPEVARADWCGEFATDCTS